MKTLSCALAAALLALPMTTSQALADRLPTAKERVHLAKVLWAHGFVSWGYIELDDGLWEVDNAVTRSGKVYDLDIRGDRVVDFERE